MIYRQNKYLKVSQVVYLFLLMLVFKSCTNRKLNNAATYEYTQIEPEQSKPVISTLVGEWKLDSTVFTDGTFRKKPQIPFSATTWTFTEDGQYVVSIQENSYKLSMEEDGTQKETSMTAETPAQKYIGKYQHINDVLHATIIGGLTKYNIVGQSDSTLHLKSQRIQVPPVSKEDSAKIAEHYFTLK
ncbi:hypothetical protein GCM10011506_00650 [Marivirga lumbricoides]|uniref:Lipocalin-like domain-containing protein n=2 Tax=Marivirga lumbricoides TaxID=1046115 RepID=A0ABQ1L703_9BACT|nr:hypothetical protein GCM10011506_00650 [Marivirga lumbricoides]